MKKSSVIYTGIMLLPFIVIASWPYQPSFQSQPKSTVGWSAPEQKIIFNYATLKEVLAELTKRFNLTFEIKTQRLPVSTLKGKIPVTAKNEDIFKLLQYNFREVRFQYNAKAKTITILPRSVQSRKK